MCSSRFTPVARVCRICKSKVNQQHHYCQECAFQKGTPLLQLPCPCFLSAVLAGNIQFNLEPFFCLLRMAGELCEVIIEGQKLTGQYLNHVIFCLLLACPCSLGSAQ
ncbi:unnamed protein product [Discosporangium mesarthrocarpum]